MSRSSILHSTPSQPSCDIRCDIRFCDNLFLVTTCDIRFWKCSGADDTPKGRRLKQNLPNGVIKVVRGHDSDANGICQKPELASTLLKTSAPANCPSVWSTHGSGWFSQRTLSFNFVKSTQMRTFLLGLGTTTLQERRPPSHCPLLL